MDALKHSRRLSADALKWTALLTMLVDHIGVALLENTYALPALAAGNGNLAYSILLIDLILRLIGRVAFPIFCYLLVQGFLYTRSVPRYAVRLAVFAAISELPFDWMVFGAPSFEAQNVYFTLLIGLLTLTALRAIERRPIRLKRIGMGAVVLCAMALALALRADYDVMGVALIAALYLTRADRLRQCRISAAVFLAVMILRALALGNGMTGALLELGCLPAFALILRCDGTRRTRVGKYAFYAFYPAHMLALYGLSRLLS